MNRLEAIALIVLLLAAGAILAWGLSGCIENLNVQLGSSSLTGATTQPASEIEKRIWKDFIQ